MIKVKSKPIILTFLLIAIAVGLNLPTQFSYSQSIDELKKSIAEKEQEIARLEAEAEKYQNEIDKTSSKAKTLNSEIARINAEINQLKNNIAITQKKIESASFQIQELNLNIDYAEAQIEENKQALRDLVQQLYELDSKNPLIILLGNKKISDVVEEFAYLDNLQENLINKTNFLRALKQDLNQNLAVSEKTKEKYNTLAQTLNAQQTIAGTKKQEKQTVLTETKNQEKIYQQLLNETVEKQKQIEAGIRELEKELSAQLNPQTLPQGKLFIWPVNGGYLTQGFGEVPYGSITRRYYSFHNGIDIGAKTGVGTPILAAADGRVEATGNNGKYAYGKWLAINHGNNLITLYAHLSYIDVTKGQSVKAGQIVGYMGATGLVTGPHLHFTVYAADSFRTENRWFGLLPLGAPLDPNDYL
ncbi:MAG: peptidoglycan DD-metalloendopeptidase family protein [Patescibacteria group bacterium]